METGMINSAAAANSTTKKAAKNTIDKDGFLQLLVAQLKNQDPTSGGQDPNAMVQQLTSFSSLEQAQQTNTLLQGLQAQTSGLFQAQTASMVGKNVKVSSSAFNLKSGAANMNTVAWNGRDINGTPLPDGPYNVTVTATGDDGKAVDVQTSLTMKVDAVTFKDGGIYLASGNSIFSLADVLEISA